MSTKVRRTFLASAALLALLKTAGASAEINAPSTNMVGSIDSKYGIAMSYVRQGDSIEGTYSYTKVGKPLHVKGTVDADNNIKLAETDAAGHQTGTFSGKLVDSERMVGQWSAPKADSNAQPMPFLLCLANKPNALQQGKDGIVITQQTKKIHQPKSETVKTNDIEINLPKVDVALLNNKQVADKIQSSLSLGKATRGTQAELLADGWLDEVDYQITYNRNYLVSCDFTISGSAAYPSGWTSHLFVDTRTGNRLTAKDLFKADSLPALKALISKRINEEGDRTIKEQKAEDPDIAELIKSGKQGDRLSDFTVSDTGVTFFHDWQFPHVALPEQPDGQYHFSYAELAPYIRPDGPLAIFLKR